MKTLLVVLSSILFLNSVESFAIEFDGRNNEFINNKNEYHATERESATSLPATVSLRKVQRLHTEKSIEDKALVGREERGCCNASPAPTDDLSSDSKLLQFYLKSAPDYEEFRTIPVVPSASKLPSWSTQMSGSNNANSGILVHTAEELENALEAGHTNVE
ncbi:glutathionyl-hydroquinone reductase, partial [Labrenzia sp. EL_13]|nr:glutathionyl-hydroquinone reductase [Labrenzia sp. EL_13]